MSTTVRWMTFLPALSAAFASATCFSMQSNALESFPCRIKSSISSTCVSKITPASAVCLMGFSWRRNSSATKKSLLVIVSGQTSFEPVPNSPMDGTSQTDHRSESSECVLKTQCLFHGGVILSEKLVCFFVFTQDAMHVRIL